MYVAGILGIPGDNHAKQVVTVALVSIVISGSFMLLFKWIQKGVIFLVGLNV